MARDAAASELIGGCLRLMRRLAGGGRGEVYAAWDESMGQQLALKRFPLSLARRAITADRMQLAAAAACLLAVA